MNIIEDMLGFKFPEQKTELKQLLADIAFKVGLCDYRDNKYQIDVYDESMYFDEYGWVRKYRVEIFEITEIKPHKFLFLKWNTYTKVLICGYRMEAVEFKGYFPMSIHGSMSGNDLISKLKEIKSTLSNHTAQKGFGHHNAIG